METADSEAEWTALQDRARAQAAMGVRSEPCDERSLYYPDDAIVDPVDVLQGAPRCLCQISGVEIVEDSPVDRLDALEAGCVVVWRPGHGAASIGGAPGTYREPFR